MWSRSLRWALPMLAPAVLAWAQAAPPVLTPTPPAFAGPTEAPILARPDMQAVPAQRMLVSAAHPLATEAGMEILRAGGSAVDAAIAVQLVLSLVEPQSSGIGGGGFLLYFDAKTGAVTSIDGRETAPASVQEGLFLKPDGTPMTFLEAIAGGRTVGVPGFFRLAEMAHKQHGRLPWRRLFAPAIRIAERGFAIGPRMFGMVDSAKTIIADFPEARAAYLDAKGAPKPVGSIIKVPANAKLLRRIARGGADVFYKGDVAKKMVDAVATSPRAPATMTLADLAAYQAVDRKPVCIEYRSYNICSMGPPSSGAITVLATLRQLERFDLKAMGANSLAATHVIGQAMSRAYADRDRYVADPAFVDVPTEGMLDRGYLAARSADIAVDAKLSAAPTAGTPPGVKSAALSPNNGPDIHGTSHWVVVDRWGNAASLTGTVQGPFGAFLKLDGFFLNNELTDFAFNPRPGGVPSVNRAEPGKRPRSSMSPTIVTDKQGRLVMAVGSAGGSAIIAHTLKTLIGVIDWNLDIQDAIELPNVTAMGLNLNVEQNTPVAALRPQLEALGWKVSVRPMVSGLHGVQAVRSADGQFVRYLGGADPRREGVALGE
jgi:gamma-glutamyltranspeptidase / glutathione hydrolase